MSFADFAADEMWYERYMEHRPITKCDQCSHACVCWKVGMDAAQYCEVFESKTKNTASMKLKELLSYIRDWENVLILVDNGRCEYWLETERAMLVEKYGERKVNYITAYINTLEIELEEEE